MVPFLRPKPAYMSVVVRFAPSPTGPLHIGGVRTALYNFLLARKTGGKFLLRIEDTDQGRFVPGAEAYILESLAWLGIQVDEGVGFGGDDGPYRQSERQAQGIYRPFVDRLVASGHAYIAFDTPEEIEAMRAREMEKGNKGPQYNAATRGSMRNSLSLSADETQALLDAGTPYVVRMKMPENEDITFVDVVRSEVTFHSGQLDDKVLMKSDGMPTYHLANVVDDHLMKVTHVIRGEEWLSSTPLHVMLYRAFGLEASMPAFVHLPLILNPNGEGKMSKRMGDKLGFSVFPITWTDPETGNVSVGYREQGYLPEAMVNFLALLGWSPGGDEEVMSAERLAAVFSLERLHHSGTKFDIDKLKWFNQTYIKAAPAETLLSGVQQAAQAAGFAASDDFLLQLIGLMRERVTLVPEFVTEARYFFEAPAQYDEKMKSKWGATEAACMQALAEKMEALPDWTVDALHGAFEAVKTELNAGNGKVLAPLRLALTGVPGGPGAFDIAALIGREESLRRIKSALATLPVV